MEYLSTIWFILIAVLFMGFFFLEGFDYGVGMLLPFIAKTDKERRIIINTIGPVWDGNEVWLITAGGAMFAAFPNWYATLFSGFYLALIFMLAGLIIRGVAFEFRSKRESQGWRNLWDWCIAIGSLLPALIMGVAFANFVRGVPIDGTMTYTGNLIQLLNPFALVSGLAFVGLFILHGANYLNLKITDELLVRAHKISKTFAFISTILLIAFVVWAVIAGHFQPSGMIVGLAAILASLIIIPAILKQLSGLSFILSGGLILLLTLSFFVSLYPNVMISSIAPDFNLTIDNASSSQYTLKIMTIVAAIFVPILLFYQAWSYWIFRKRINANSYLEY